MTLFRCQHCSGGSSEASDQGRAHQNASGHDFHGLFLEEKLPYSLSHSDSMRLDCLGTVASHQDMFELLSSEPNNRAKPGKESAAFFNDQNQAMHERSLSQYSINRWSSLEF